MTVAMTKQHQQDQPETAPTRDRQTAVLGSAIVVAMVVGAALLGVAFVNSVQGSQAPGKQAKAIAERLASDPVERAQLRAQMGAPGVHIPLVLAGDLAPRDETGDIVALAHPGVADVIDLGRRENVNEVLGTWVGLGPDGWSGPVMCSVRLTDTTAVADC